MPDPMHSNDRQPKKVIPIVPESVSLYEARKKIQPRSISGKFTSWRWIMVWVT